MSSNNKWFKVVIYVMIASMLLSTILYTVGFLIG